MAVVASSPGELVLSLHYSDGTVYLFDNHVLAWVVDETGKVAPVPQTVGTLPPASDAGPQWASVMANGTVLVPDQLRSPLHEFFTWLSERDLLLNGDGLTQGFIAEAWRGWATTNTSKVASA